MNLISNDECDQVDQVRFTERINGVSKFLDTPFFYAFDRSLPTNSSR